MKASHQHPYAGLRYRKPVVERIGISVEQGFAISGGNESLEEGEEI